MAKNTSLLLAPLLLTLSCTQTSDTTSSGGGTTTTGNQVLFVGHSQVNHVMPGFFKWLGDTASKNKTVERQATAGANLEENFVTHTQFTDEQNTSLDPNGKYVYFDTKFSNKGIDAVADLANGLTEHLVITEEHGLTQAQARDSDFKTKYSLTFPSTEVEPESGADSWALNNFARTYGLGGGLSFYTTAVNAKSDVKVYLYENWFPPVNGSTHCTRLEGSTATKTLGEINSWRKRIHAYIGAWNGLAAEMNAARGTTLSGFSYGTTVIGETTVPSGEAVTVIPVAQALSVLTEKICAGEVGTLTNPNELFSDHAHASRVGDHFIAAVMYAAIYGESAESIELSGTSTALDGTTTIAAIDSTVASQMQKIAYDVVNGTESANATDISSCSGITNTTFTVADEQFCADSSDNETIPAY